MRVNEDIIEEAFSRHFVLRGRGAKRLIRSLIISKIEDDGDDNISCFEMKGWNSDGYLAFSDIESKQLVVIFIEHVLSNDLAEHKLNQIADYLFSLDTEGIHGELSVVRPKFNTVTSFNCRDLLKYSTRSKPFGGSSAAHHEWTYR